ncbi:hypothetical protein JCM19232_3357 [Vibrio ishigakensis]|uniref:Uncharacterized protein n=1 Tax=Vibrio ishigakensis TaxID=1481914 RepID=A0A0B8PCI3_9VIBR|nr:hypothetical protein [Vibrio ishigakensis]GAM58657.1 hypothetical protein JCM19231_1560 [Vibrio ishigakensis]GAM64081.1 hypothetical protein JCM19232_3357 [Vibrio ishigakensis]GAM71593.1 hypothetical protein JCM19236_4182 [Vibrio sp. JCM 19236]GAM75080.1 hypothetical protein JCM19241_1423 [Vibrio ishigakensis]
MPIGRERLVKTALENMFDFTLDLAFKVRDLGAGKVEIIIKQGQFACSKPYVMDREEVRSFLYAEESTRKNVYEFGIEFTKTSHLQQSKQSHQLELA